MNRILLLALLLAGAVPAYPASNDELDCPPNANFLTGCFEQWQDFGKDNTLAKAAASANETQSELFSSLLGLVTGTEAGSANTTRADFLPQLFFDVTDLGGTGLVFEGVEDDTAEQIGVSWNVPVCDSCLQLNASFTRSPKVSDAIMETVPEDDQESVRMSLASDLTSLDDADYGFRYSYTGKIGDIQFGRNPAGYIQDIQLIQAMTLVNRANRNAMEFLRDMQDAGIISNIERLALVSYVAGQSAAGMTFHDLTAAQQDQLKNAFLQSFSYSGEDLFRIFVDRIDQQPQLILSGSRIERDPRVGPDVTAGEVKLEIPLSRSFNALRRHVGPHCLGFSQSAVDTFFARNDSGTIQSQAQRCLDRLASAATDLDEPSWRASLSATYRDAEDHTLMPDQFPVDFMAPGSNSLIVTGAFGRRLNQIGSIPSSQLDIALSHEDVSDDPTKNDRTKLTITWSIPFGELTIPISVIYANKPELDLMDADEQLGARIGMKYSIDRLSND